MEEEKARSKKNKKKQLFSKFYNYWRTNFNPTFTNDTVGVRFCNFDGTKIWQNLILTLIFC